MTIKSHILPIIVISQFCCTSLWFAGNGVMSNLVEDFNLANNALGHLTSAVQLGFIVGTLIFALLTIADRYSPSKVFMVCALIGGLFNLGIIIEGNSITSLVALRFLTGLFLAGIYPVGMKIAADYYDKGLGKSLGFLVGALVVGTAFPHFLKNFAGEFSWRIVLVCTSSLAALGGILIVLFVPDGPHRKASTQVDLSAFFKVFNNKKFRSAAFGYFGHMWELYAFWAFVPIILTTYTHIHPSSNLNIPLLSFIIIAVGGPACVVAGYLSQQWGSKRIASIALFLSGLCCIISPFAFGLDSSNLFIAFLLFWGLVVIADSPLFSTLVAQNAAVETKGTALTIVNSIGFAITIISIQLLNILAQSINPTYLFIFLSIGPIMGLVALFSRNKS